MADTLTRERVDRGTGTELGPPWHVIVLNDDHNTFDGVAHALAAVDALHTTDGGLRTGHREVADTTGRLRERGLTWLRSSSLAPRRSKLEAVLRRQRSRRRFARGGRPPRLPRGRRRGSPATRTRARQPPARATGRRPPTPARRSRKIRNVRSRYRRRSRRRSAPRRGTPRPRSRPSSRPSRTSGTADASARASPRRLRPRRRAASRPA